MKKVRIYQLPVEHKAKFMDFEFVKENNIMPKQEDYKLVWEGEVEDDNTLDDIYTMFNIGKYPEDFKGHSLSMSDLVCMDEKFWYCDDYGWKDITDNFPKPILVKGEKYECIEDYLMDDGSVAYKAGKVYEVLNEQGHLGNDESGCETHKMSEERDFYCYFKKVQDNVKKIYIITADGVTFNIWYETREEANARAEKLNEEYYMHKVWNVEEVIDEDFTNESSLINLKAKAGELISKRDGYRNAYLKAAKDGNRTYAKECYALMNEATSELTKIKEQIGGFSASIFFHPEDEPQEVVA